VSILARYLARSWLAVFLAAMGATGSLYVVIDVFDRVGEVLPFSPAWTAILSYFLFKLPKILFDVFPAACLLATLVTIGTMSRTREIVAMRACGLSTRRIAAPMLAAALLLSFAALTWSELVVPVAATRSRWLWDVELKQKVYRGVFDSASLWFQTERGFVHLRRYDAGARVISGLSLYEAGPDFDLERIVEVDSMTWQDGRWTASSGFVKELSGEGPRVRPLSAGEFQLDEDPENLAARKRRPEEFSSRQLNRQIAQLQARGLGADEYLVDLHHKLAWPFAGFFVALLGVPLGLRTAGRQAGLARSTATGLVIGFAYWIATGLALSAGRTGGLPPLLAAWLANLGCFVLALGLYSRGASR
jgi:lipopolysaccharide export system permease protein